MASIDITRSSLALDVASFFNHVAALVSNWNDARVTRRTLSGLSDRELEDIGLARGDIERISITH